ncbi:hypothetical protein D3C73_1146690 [compost metagenome]
MSCLHRAMQALSTSAGLPRSSACRIGLSNVLRCSRRSSRWARPERLNGLVRYASGSCSRALSTMAWLVSAVTMTNTASWLISFSDIRSSSTC